MLSCTNRVLSQASLKNSILHTIFKKEVKQSQQNYHTVGIVSKKLIRQCQTKGTWGILRTLQTKCTLALEMITSPLLWEELGPQDLKPRSPNAPAKPLSALPLPGFREVATFLSIHQCLREKSPKGPGPRLLLAGPSTFLVLKRS